MLDFKQNYFELFELPIDFNVDLESLAQRYRRLQGVLHPDRFARAPDHERRIALQAATRVNEAYQTLRKPLSRAQYMLELHGEGMTVQAETTSDADFLMQQMELREALAELANAPPAADERLERLREWIRGLYDRQLADLAALFEGADVQSVASTQDAVRKLQFLEKLSAEADAVEARLDEAM